MNGGDDETRTRDLCRDRSTFNDMEEHGRHCKSLEVHHRQRYCVSRCVSRRLLPTVPDRRVISNLSVSRTESDPRGVDGNVTERFGFLVRMRRNCRETLQLLCSTGPNLVLYSKMAVSLGKFAFRRMPVLKLREARRLRELRTSD